MRWSFVPALVVLAASACDTPAAPPLRLETVLMADNIRLVLVAAPGVRINARLKPALELPDGHVLWFDSPHVSADSNYFTTSPTAELKDLLSAPHGTIRASICNDGERFCRTVTIGT